MTTDTKRGLTKEEREFAAKHSTDYELAKVLCEDLDAAEAEIETHQLEAQKLAKRSAENFKRAQAAEERERVLREALEWYADEAHKWHECGDMPGPKYDRDRGRRARAALGKTT